MYKTKVMIDKELIKIWQSSSEQEREIIPATVMIPFFSYQAYHLTLLLPKIGASILVLWCIYIIIRLKSLKKYKPAVPTISYSEYLLQTKQYLIVQKKLLENVVYWYILPCVIGLFLMNINHDPSKQIVSFIISTVFGIFVYFLNKYAVKKDFIPRIQKIDTAIKNLQED